MYRAYFLLPKTTFHHYIISFWSDMLFYQLVSFVLLQSSIGATSTYYITNSTINVKNHTCLVENMLFDQCLTLEMLAEDFNSNGTIVNASNVSVIFINQNYYMHENLKLLFIAISAVQLKPWITNRHVSIYCMGDLSIIYSGIRIITIESVEFYDCGKFQPLITFSKTNTTTEMIALINSSFHRSIYGSIHICGQVVELKVINCLFCENMNEYGVHIESVSSVDFKNSTFSNNAAGSVIFYGLTETASSKFSHCYFRNNTSEDETYGSAIDVHNISLLNIFIKNCTFQKSVGPSVRINTGLIKPIYLVGSIEITNSNFQENVAHSSGDVVINGIFNISVITSNFSDINGAGSINVFNVLSVYIEACNFFNNYNNDYVTRRALNLFLSQRVSVIGCNFQFNTAENGGALYAGLGTALNIQNCTFSNNSAQKGGALHIYAVHNFNMTNCTIKYNKACGDAGALSIFTNIYIEVNVTVSYCAFVGNQAGGHGGVFAGNLNFLNISNSNFTNNVANGSGGALIMDSSNLSIYNSIFLKNQARIEGGAIITHHNVIRILQKVIVFNTTLDKNSAMRGGAMAIKSGELHLHSLTFYENHAEQMGGALFIGIHKNHHYPVSVLYNCSFFSSQVNNSHGIGGAIAVETHFELHLNLCNFFHNKAGYGGAIYLYNVSTYVLDCSFVRNEAYYSGGSIFSNMSVINSANLTISTGMASFTGGGIVLYHTKLTFNGTTTFTENQVKLDSGKGGAIFVMDEKEDCRVDSCSLSWTNHTKLVFTTNLKTIAPLVFGGMIDRCNSPQLIASVADIIVNGERYNFRSGSISSKVVRFCFCENSSPTCEKRKLNKTVAPSQTLSVDVACVDQLDQPKPCNVSSEFMGKGLQLGQGQHFRHITNCDKLTFNAYTRKQKFSTLILTGEIFCNETRSDTLKIYVGVTHCPLGFQKMEDRCYCESRLNNTFADIQCNIDTNSITLKEGGWFSYDGGYLRVHKNCPLNYCSSNRNSIPLSNPDAQCKNHRSGILCGSCVDNYSVVLGSWKCRQCSHLSKYNFIWLSIVIALAGVVLIVFLLLLKMTVSSGTINGLILYANILSSSGLLDYQTCSLHPILRVFLSWINLDFGIEACFYSGMDVYQKSWLQYAFPFYIWFLVGVIILFCHYSSTVMKLMGRRNIEVLATLFLLSYSKLLKTTVSSLSFTNIMVATANNLTDVLKPHKVWLYDGHVTFFSSKHLPLFIVSFIFLVFLFLPYSSLMLVGQLLRSLPRKRGLGCLRSIFISSIMDAYHAPYTKHHRYWTGLGLLIRCCLFTIFATSYSVRSNLLWIILAVTVMITIRQASRTAVYQKNIANLLELVYLINLLVLASLLLYNDRVCAILTSSASFSLFVFILIILYHLHLVIKANTNCYRPLKEKIKQAIRKKSSESLASLKSEALHESKELSTTYFELRESLIDS